MGAFASTLFDGDPYVNDMRSYPNKEITWWIKQFVMGAEGVTLVQHIMHTYPSIFVYKCDHCNGAGTVTCPHCNGYKIRKATSHNGFRLSEQTTVGRLLATAGSQECDHCGGYCQWDVESEWQGMWNEWEKKLAYYDRSRHRYNLLWEEGVAVGEREVNEYEDERDKKESKARRERAERKRQASGKVPSAVDFFDSDLSEELDKEVMEKRTKNITDRLGGHPYVNYNIIPSSIYDYRMQDEEARELLEFDYSFLPREVDPIVYPDLLLKHDSPLHQMDHQIKMEDVIMQNLDAAMQNKPKPILLGPTAGTVACPECKGRARWISMTPNLNLIFRAETPFWIRTLTNMNMLGTSQEVWDAAAASPSATLRQALSVRGGDDGGSSYTPQPSSSSSAAAAAAAAFVRGAGRRGSLGEVPNHPYKELQIQAALDSAGNAWHYDTAAGGGVNGRSVLSAPADEDPLSYTSTSLPPLEPRNPNPISKMEAVEAQQMYRNLNPVKNIARAIRARRNPRWEGDSER